MAFTTLFLTARITGRAYRVQVTESTLERLQGSPRWLPYPPDTRRAYGAMRRGRPEPLLRLREEVILDATFEFDEAPSVAEVLARVAEVCSDDMLPAGPDMAVSVAVGELPGQLAMF